MNYSLDTNTCIYHLNYASIRAGLERKGQLIGQNDIVIAATTLAHSAILVTNNTKEFSRIDGLKIEDWIQPN